MEMMGGMSSLIALTGMGDTRAVGSEVTVGKTEEAARDFEALLLTPVLTSLEKTFGADFDDGKMPGASDYRLMGTQALAKLMVEHGGIGIAKLIVKHLEPKHPGP